MNFYGITISMIDIPDVTGFDGLAEKVVVGLCKGETVIKKCFVGVVVYSDGDDSIKMKTGS